MRSQLEQIPEIHAYETDIVAQTVTLQFLPGFDWKKQLDELAASHDKFENWSVFEQ